MPEEYKMRGAKEETRNEFKKYTMKANKFAVKS